MVALTGENNLQRQAGGPLLDVITEIGNGIRLAMDAIGPEVRESLDQIGSGLRGFIDSLAGADTSGLENIAATILSVASRLAGAAGFVLLIGADILTDIFENVMPKIGGGIAALVTIISGIGKGDPGMILQGIGDGLRNLIGAILGAITGFADPLIGAINDLTGGNLPKLSTLLDVARDALMRIRLWADNNIQPILDVLQTFVDWFFNEEHGLSSVVNFLRDVVQLAIDVFTGNLTGIWEKVRGPLNTFKEGIERIFNWIKVNVIDPLAEAIANVANALAGLTGSAGAENSVLQLEAGDWGDKRDVGGPGLAGMPYLIGRGAQPELFVPQTNGQFIPNADKLGSTYNISVVMPEAALENPDRSRALGKDFAQAILEELDRL